MSNRGAARAAPFFIRCLTGGGAAMGTIAAAVAAILILTLPAGAQAFRCGTGLVKTGDTTGRVLIECGPPSYKEGAGTKTKAKSVKIDKTKDVPVEQKTTRGASRKVERWFYNCGEHDFLYILTFEGGVLTKEETQGYGKGKSDCEGRR
jgi:hypothetical protein